MNSEEVLPRSERQCDRGERAGDQDEEEAADQAAEARRPHTEPHGAPRLALARHREAVEGGRDGARRARNAKEARGDETAS
jgi:hypothetical protein